MSRYNGKYNEGDKVKIREDLDIVGRNGAFESTVGYNEEMAKYAGTTMTISQISVNGYKMIEDSGYWIWNDEMLDLDLSSSKSESKEKKPMVEHKAITQIDREMIMKEMYDTLDICDIYHPTDEGMNAIYDEWAKQKGTADAWKGNSVLDILSKHPDYVPEKGYIVKKNEYDRGIDISVITEVLDNIISTLAYPENSDILTEIKTKPFTYDECYENKRYLGDVLVALSTDRTSIKWNGMSYEDVKKEYDKWERRANDFSNKYYIHYKKTYDWEEKKKYQKASRLIQDIRRWVVDKIRNLKEDENATQILIDETVKEFVDNYDLGIRGIRSNQKFNKVIIKILTELGINTKWDGYNKQIARLGDASSPTKFTRFTIVSANPVDYWRMSFGSSWSSCHTIDKQSNYRPSDGGDNYEGMHASGTESYMLDPSSLVMYTVDKAYDGSDYELEPKINRCMFHLGEGKFVMGRVYPQGTDGEDEVYRQWRRIFQQIIAECMGVPNYWKTEKDVNEKLRQIYSTGTHYRDYECGYCNIAGWSYLKPESDSVPSEIRIKIGATPICPSCGKPHWVDDNIECEDCNNDGYRICNCCGSEHDEEYMHYIDGEWYCEDCCFYCEYHNEWETGDSIYIEGYGDVCEYAVEDNDDFSCCEHCGTWYYTRDNDEGIYTEDGYYYCCESCAERDDYVCCSDDLWRYKSDAHYCDRCEQWIADGDWDSELEMCVQCAEEVEDESEENIA